MIVSNGSYSAIEEASTGSTASRKSSAARTSRSVMKCG